MANQSGSSSDNFNPQSRLQNAEDFTNFSKGFTDDAAGDFATGIGKDLDVGVGAIDRGFAQSADDEVRAAVNETDATMLGVSNQPPAADPLKQEVTDQVNSLRSKKLAMDNGTIDPDHYYATVTAKVKGIRARYAGYDDQIDEDLKKIGIDPNWQRKQIIEEGIKAQNAASARANEADKDRREFWQAAINNPKLAVPPEFATKMMDQNFYKSDSNMQQLRGYLLKQQHIEATNNNLKIDAENTANTDKSKGDKLGFAYGKDLSTALWTGIVKSGAADVVQKLSSSINQEALANNGAVDPEHINQLRQAVAKLRQQGEAARMNITAQYADNLPYFTKQKADQDSWYNEFFDNIEKHIANKDWGGLAENTNAVETMTTGRQAQLLDGHEVYKDIAAGRKIMGDTYTGTYVAQNTAEYKDAVKADAVSSVTRDIANNKVSSFQAGLVRLRDKGVEDPAAFKGAFDQSIGGILNKDTKDSGKVALAKAMYSPENTTFFDNVMNNKNLSPSEQRQYFKKMTSPILAQEIERLATYDPSIRSNYYSMVQYMSGKMNQNSVSDINDAVQYSTNSTVIVDPANPLHLAVAPVAGGGSTIGGFWDGIKGSAHTEAVNNWNTSIDAMVPIWKAQGINPEQAVQTIMERSGIDLNAPKKGNSVDSAVKSLALPNQTFNPRGNAGAGITPNSSTFDLSKGPQGFNPRGGSTAPTSNAVGNFLQGLDFGAPGHAKAQEGPSKLGGPDLPDSDTQPRFNVPTQEQMDARTGILGEIKEFNALYASTEDPELKAEYRKHIAELMDDYRGAKGTQQSFRPRGAPTAENTPESQAVGKAGLDAVTGIPSLVDAIKSGDPKEITKQSLLAAANIIPFPAGGKAAKIAAEVLDHPEAQKILSTMASETKELLDNLPTQAADKIKLQFVKETLDASKATKGLEELKGQVNQVFTDAKKAIGPGTNDNVINSDKLEFARAAKGLAAEEAAGKIKATSQVYDAIGLKGPEDIVNLSDDALKNAMAVINTGVSSNRFSKEERQVLGKVYDEFTNELVKRNSVPYTTGMQKLDDIRTEKLSDKLAEFSENRSQKLADKYTPQQISDEIAKFKQFKEFASDSRTAAGHQKEIDLLERARAIHREKIKPVK